MSAIAPRNWWLWLLLAGSLALAAAVRAQAPDQRISRVLADWKRRQQAVQTIRYTLTGQVLHTKGSMRDMSRWKPTDPPKPPRDVTEQIDYRLLLDFAGQRLRWDGQEERYLADRDKVFPRVFTSVYDRTDSMTAWPRADNAGSYVYEDPLWPDVSVHRRPDQGYMVINGLGLFVGPLLLGHGLVRGLAARAGFRQEFDAEGFYVHGEGVQAARRCLVLRSHPLDLPDKRPTFDEFWVDVERDSAVLRQVSWSTGVLTTDEKIAYRATPHGWLVSDWKSTHFSPEGRTLYVRRMRATEVVPEAAVEDADFCVAIEPGMIVREFTPIEGTSVGATRKDYRVQPDGGWNEIVNGVERQSLGLRGGWAFWACGLGGGFFVLLIALLARRRWRRGHRLPPAAPPHPIPSA